MKSLIFSLVGASLLTAGAAEAHSGQPRYNAASTYERGPSPQSYGQSPGSGYWSQSRAQTWHSDTGWQPGLSAVGAYGYNYGYGGAASQPPVVVAAPYHNYPSYSQGIGQVQRSQPFGYVVDGYGRYPWNRYGHSYGFDHGGYRGPAHDCNCQPAPQAVVYQQPAPAYYQSAPVYYQAPPVHVTQPPIYVQPGPVYVEGAQVHVQSAPVHVAPPTVEVAPPHIHYDQGYFAVPAENPPPPPPPSPTERPYRQERGERG